MNTKNIKTNNNLSNDTDVNNRPIPNSEDTGVREDTGKSGITGTCGTSGVTGMSGNNETKFSGDKKNVDVDKNRNDKDCGTSKNCTGINDEKNVKDRPLVDENKSNLKSNSGPSEKEGRKVNEKS